MKTFRVTVDGQSYTVQVEEVEGSSASGSDNKYSSLSKSEPATAVEKQPAVKEQGKEVKPQAVSGDAEKPSQAKPSPVGGSNVKAPMPGSVLDVKVSVGDEIKEGDVLLILEAMKMENELTASQAGTVIEVLVKKGETVNSGDPLVILS